MKTFVVKKDAIMLDDHEVNKIKKDLLVEIMLTTYASSAYDGYKSPRHSPLKNTVAYDVLVDMVNDDLVERIAYDHYRNLSTWRLTNKGKEWLDEQRTD